MYAPRDYKKWQKIGTDTGTEWKLNKGLGENDKMWFFFFFFVGQIFIDMRK